MPWRIDKVSDGYKLYNLDKKKYVNKKFNTKLSAVNARKNYNRYIKNGFRRKDTKKVELLSVSNIIEIEKIKSILINHPDLLSFFQIMCEIVNEEINDE